MKENDNNEIDVNDNDKLFNDSKKTRILPKQDKVDENNNDYKEKMIGYEERENLVKVFKDLEEVLNEKEGDKKTINEVYEKYVGNKFITKSKIKQEVSDILLRFMFFFIGPIFGIIYLIGIFQMKSIMNALWDLVQVSFGDYYNCTFESNCNITISDNKTNVYNFYEYYYSYAMNEEIDFNLMLITGFIGTLILESKGFKISTVILGIINLAGIICLLSFDFNFKSPGKFDYGFLKLFCLFSIYIFLYAAIGGSALLSHQILVESHLKYKNYLIQKKRGASKKYELLENDLNKDNKLESNKKKDKLSEKNINKDNKLEKNCELSQISSYEGNNIIIRKNDYKKSNINNLPNEEENNRKTDFEISKKINKLNKEENDIIFRKTDFEILNKNNKLNIDELKLDYSKTLNKREEQQKLEDKL